MYVTIDPAADDGGCDVWGPDHQCLSIRQGHACEVPAWAEKAVRGLAHVIECDENGDPLGSGGGGD